MFGFCPECGTSSYVVSDKEYKHFLEKHPSNPDYYGVFYKNNHDSENEMVKKSYSYYNKLY
ncbi:E1-like enzyme family protein [Methanohalobium evestigatum Z-7303]|uniref:E1-like enzyme family protein n=1 Tax=Methanohalobium evestigatum (strain ATCC BAA-1072 / DSM 3721 / NBRC 107634 / OCM 161 / Z-7303) TaxID=644295 RepID=D7E844_METEZ|nr:E1-like enzyme family protein [Methanohalobium evestigatum Z-7303]